jgi:cobaltochelatase CobN
MHLLATTSGVIDGAAEAVDLKQSPADIVVLSAADSEIAALARAYDTGTFPTLRLANVLHLQHNLSVDLYIEKTLSLARLVVLRLLGGASYWPYGLDRIEALAKDNDIKLVVLPGDSPPDPELTSRSNLPMQDCERLRQYLVAGGQFNATKFLGYCRHLLEAAEMPTPAEAPPANGIYRRTAKRIDPLPRSYRRCTNRTHRCPDRCPVKTGHWLRGDFRDQPERQGQCQFPSRLPCGTSTQPGAERHLVRGLIGRKWRSPGTI